MTTDHQGAEALKPCPWCGSTDLKAFNYTKPEPDSFVQCYGCTTIGPSGKSEDEARAAWNRRPAPASDLRAAAQAVVDRWDSPQWKDEPHTAEFINRLRRALEDVGGGEGQA